ncbi:MAG: hypothetical protein VB089_22115 [Anaerolineaceae bacterium]|nr:hypothetical protein [Anaerolineaceae bacterium]
MEVEKVSKRNIWLARVLILMVLAWNVQCAGVFILSPEDYAPGFELSGVPGAVMVRSMGILFLMWNVPYLWAAVHPGRHCISLYEAIIMQAIGLFGETWMNVELGGGHPILSTTGWRFILFDGTGLALLALAALVVHLPGRGRASPAAGMGLMR